MALKITVVDTKTDESVPVPNSVKAEFEEVYKQLTKEEGDHKAFLEFDSKKELESWMDHARRYAKSRAPKALRFRQLPSVNLPENQVWVRITDDLEENGARRGRANTR